MNFKRKKDLALKQIAELAALDANADAANNSKVRPCCGISALLTEEESFILKNIDLGYDTTSF